MDKNQEKIKLREKQFFKTFKGKNTFKYLSNLNTNTLKKNFRKFYEISTINFKLSTFLNENNLIFSNINFFR